MNKANGSEVVNLSDTQEINGMKSFNCGNIRVGSPSGIYAIYNYLGQLYRGVNAPDPGHYPAPSAFVDIATATPPEEHDLPLAEGVTRGKRCVYSKAQDGLVVVRFSAKFPAAPSRQQIIGTLPVDYRPSEATSGAGKVGHESGDAASTATVELWGDGRLTVYGNTTGFINASGVVVFYAP